MTGQEAIDLIQARLGNRTGLSETWILLELKNAQARLEKSAELPWFMDTQASAFATTASTRTLALPSGFRRELDLGFYGTNADGDVKEIPKEDYRILRANNSDYDTAAFPEFYAIVGSTIYFFPAPAAVYTLEFWYSAAQTVIAVGAENTWLLHYPELVVSEATIPIARFLRDKDYIGIAQASIQTETARMQTDNVAYREANASRYLASAQ